MIEKIGDEINERLLEAIEAVVNQQIAENDPPETLETLERLQEEGFSREEAYTLIGHLVSLEVAEELIGKEGLDIKRYRAALRALPAPFAEPKKKEEEDLGGHLPPTSIGAR